ncbi:MAG: tRNA pseudouridine(55) synthase TruB [Nitrospirae bacterium]|nr:MAG: tRNA pseudouridine(55) synthase TruB [Nitrospirota bacterium]
MPTIEGSHMAIEGSVKASVASILGDGILNVNKARGWTSHDVVAKLRGLLGVPRVGHAGTLDPAATGVLPVLVGRGTRIAEYLMDWDKEYHAVLRLGETTDTQDATGAVLTRSSTDSLTESGIRAAIQRFQGKLTQVPPMYSAVKVGGVPLYRVARAGRTVQRGPREVVVHEIEVLGIAGHDVSLRVACSKGTYVRTLCADIGEALGVGGHLVALERTRVGPLTVEHALSVEAIGSKFLLGRLGEDVMSLDAALGYFPSLTLDQTTSARVLHGVQVPFGALKGDEKIAGMASGRPVRLKDPSGRLLALGMMSAGDKPVMRILKVLAEG